MHGGNQKRGLAHHSTKHGFYSKSLPLRLSGHYEEALADAELLSTRKDAALITAFVDEQLEKLDTGETGAHWARLQAAWAEYLKAGDRDRDHKLFYVGRLIEEGASEAEAMREIRSAVMARARLADSERKHLAESEQMMSAQQIVAIVATLSAAIIAEVVDREQRARILERFDRALSAGAARAIAS